MSLINLGHNYKADVEKARKRDNALEKQLDRFKYPKPSSDVSDMVKSLLPVRWDDIYFPVTELTTDVAQAVIEHKYPNRDSARLEAMGREPLIIKCKAVFVNTIVPGPTDNWKQGDLYPYTYIKLLLSSFSGDTKKLQHPVIGEINCKMISFNPVIDAKFRGGELVNITWKETIVGDLDSTLQSLESRVASAKHNAAALDNMMPDLIPSPADLAIPVYKDSLLDLINKLETYVSFPLKFAGQIIGTVASLEGRCQIIISKIKSNYQTTWGQANQLAYKLKADSKWFRDAAKWASGNSVSSRITATFITDRRTVFTNLCARLQNTYSDLSALNPELAKMVSIPVGTSVQYYKS